jgi:thioredoxin 1
MKLLILSAFLLFITKETCAQNNSKKQEKTKVTFIELGSVKCIPCQKMQKVIKQVEENYPSQVKTIFYDVWTEGGKKYAEIYNINLIPTQVFLDEKGKEFYRHEGFFPFEELDAIIKNQLK